MLFDPLLLLEAAGGDAVVLGIDGEHLPTLPVAHRIRVGIVHRAVRLEQRDGRFIASTDDHVADRELLPARGTNGGRVGGGAFVVQAPIQRIDHLDGVGEQQRVLSGSHIGFVGGQGVARSPSASSAWKSKGPPSTRTRPTGWSSGASTTTTGFEHHMSSYVEYLMADGRWSELRPQLDNNDGGNSHHRMLDTYMRMLAEYRRIIDGRNRGFHPDDYLLSMEELAQVAAARVHPSNRG